MTSTEGRTPKSAATMASDMCPRCKRDNTDPWALCADCASVTSSTPNPTETISDEAVDAAAGALAATYWEGRPTQDDRDYARTALAAALPALRAQIETEDRKKLESAEGRLRGIGQAIKFRVFNAVVAELTEHTVGDTCDECTALRSALTQVRCPECNHLPGCACPDTATPEGCITCLTEAALNGRKGGQS